MRSQARNQTLSIKHKKLPPKFDTIQNFFLLATQSAYFELIWFYKKGEWFINLHIFLSN